jgi:hypothetical protein
MGDETLSGGGDLGGGGVSSDTSGAPSAAETAPRPTLDSIFADAEREVNGEVEAIPVNPAATQAPTTAPAIAAQPEQAQVEPAPESQGEPPPERWDTIKANIREKTREETLQQVVAEYGPRLQVIEQLRTNPVETLGQLWDELSSDPRYAQQMRSLSARGLRSGRQQNLPAAEHEEPQPDLDAGNGLLLYSAPQQAKREAWMRSQMQQEFQNELAPLKQEYQTRQQREQHDAKVAKFREESEKQLSADISEWKQMPHFQENIKEIATLQAQIYAEGQGKVSPVVALRRAYGRVVQNAVPKAQQQTVQSMEASAAQKLRAATINPSQSAPAASRRPRSWTEAFEQAEAELSR